MKRVVAIVGTLLMADTAHAHVSDASGMTHAFEHLWLLLVLVPMLLLLRPLARWLMRGRRRGL